MDAQTLATILLGLRIVAVVTLVAVIFKQIKQLRTTTTEYPAVRIGVFIATIVILLGQFIPITLDSIVVFGSTYAGRNTTPTVLSSTYALSNAGQDVIIGLLLAFQHLRPRKKRD